MKQNNKKERYFTLFFIFMLLLCNSSKAQNKDSTSFYQPLLIDDVVIRAKNSGFDIKKFIEIIQNDTTFYKAFKTLNLSTFNAENNIKIYEKDGKAVKASLQSETKQIYRNHCRTMNVLEEHTTGDFYKKNGDYNYFTAALYANVFFTEGKICGENNIVKGSFEKEGKGKGRIAKSKIQLKHLIFNPGSSVSGVPFIGNKVAIFEPEIAKMYDFKLISENKNGIPCYLFEAKAKPEYSKDVVINIFKSWLNINDYAIVSRTYSLSYKAGIYDFDVKMHVDLKKVGSTLLPSYISYNGNWFVLTKGRERAQFVATFDY